MVGALAGRNEKIRKIIKGLDRIQRRARRLGDGREHRVPERGFFGIRKTASTLEKRRILQALDQVALGGPWTHWNVFVVLRPFMRWITDSFQDTVEDMLPKTIEEPRRVCSRSTTPARHERRAPGAGRGARSGQGESELLRERIYEPDGTDTEKSRRRLQLVAVEEGPT